MTKIKICGLFRPEDIEYVNEALPDYIGFVFARSRREVTGDAAARLREKLDPRIKAVGVFVDAPPEEVLQLLKRGVIDIAQLHGKEDSGYILKIKQEAQKPVIKAVSVASEEDIRKAEEIPADYLLFDHGKGGTGKVFDWSLVQGCRKPYFLAGGLNTENIEAALASLSPFAIDTSSGVETDGRKDRDKILEIVRRVQNDKR